MFSDSVAQIWDPKSEAEFENGACGKGCSHTYAMRSEGEAYGENDMVIPWECSHGSWLMPTGKKQATSQLFSGPWDWENAPYMPAIGTARTWGEEAYLADLEFYASESPEQRAMRHAAMAAGEKAAEARIIDHKVLRKEEKWADKSGAMKFRVPRPCRYASLYEKRICAGCGEHLPKDSDICVGKIVKVEQQERRHDGRLVNTGNLVSRLALPGECGQLCGEKLAGCWNHEQHKTCIYVHPDEPQWAAACAGTLRVKEDNRLIFCMEGEERAAAVAQRPAAVARFSALGPGPTSGHHGRGGGGNHGRGGGGQQHARPPRGPAGGGSASANTWGNRGGGPAHNTAPTNPWVEVATALCSAASKAAATSTTNPWGNRGGRT